MAAIIWDQTNVEIVKKMWGTHAIEEIVALINENLKIKFNGKKIIWNTTPRGVVFEALKQKLINKREADNYSKELARIKRKKRFIKEEIRMQVFNHDNNKCLLCGGVENLSVDHIIPIELGGDNSLDNLQTLCIKCNSVKMLQIVNFREPFENYICVDCNRWHYRNLK